MVRAAAILLAAAPRPAAAPRETPDFVAPAIFTERAAPRLSLDPALQARLDKLLDRIEVSGSAVCWKMRW